MENKVIEFTRDYFKYDLRSDGFGLERYVDYNDEFPKRAISEILESENPLETYDEQVFEWDTCSEDWSYQNDFWKELEEFCESNGFDFDEAKDVVYSNFYWCYPDTFLNPTVDISLRINCGDMNYDYACHNQLSYAKDMYHFGSELDEKAGLYFLAKSQKKLTALKKAIKDVYNNKINASDIEDNFVRTSVEELENLTGTIAPLQIIVKMPLLDAINLQAKINSMPDEEQYYPGRIEGTPYGYVTIPKTAICGFNSYYASSLMGITLEKDVVIPVQFIINAGSADWYYDLCVRPDADLTAKVKIA